MPVYQDARGRYYVDFTASGKRIFRRCPKGATKAQAKAYEAKLRSDLWNQRLGRKPLVTLAAALQNHIEKSIKGTRSEGKAEAAVYRLLDHVRGKSILEAPEAAESFVSAARGQYSVASINRSLAALRRSCSLAYKAGWIDQPIHTRISLLPGETKRTVWLTPEEVQRLVDAAKHQRTKDMILLLSYTGLRLGELLSISKSAAKNGYIQVQTGKTGEPRSIPIHPLLRSCVKRLPISGKRRVLQKSFDWARKKAGMPDVRLHDLRHTFGSWLAQNNTAGATIMELMGHKSFATTRRYLHLNQEAKRKAIRGLK